MDLQYLEKEMSLVIFLCPAKKEFDFDVVSLMEVFLEEYREKRMRVPSFSRDFFEEARKSKTKTRFVFGPECIESGVDFLEGLCIELTGDNFDPTEVVSFLDMVVDFCGDPSKIH